MFSNSVERMTIGVGTGSSIAAAAARGCTFLPSSYAKPPIILFCSGPAEYCVAGQGAKMAQGQMGEPLQHDKGGTARPCL